MLKMKRKASDYLLVIVCVLLFSFIVNVFSYFENVKYKYRVSRESYTNVEKIKSINAVNNEILISGIQIGSLDNMELLKLYKNYGELSDCSTSLWDEYLFYEESSSFFTFNKKKINMDNVSFHDLYGDIEIYIQGLLEEEMKTKTYKVNLEGDALEKFSCYLSLSTELNDYYNEFYNVNLNGVAPEKIEEKIVNNDYWIDIFEQINILNTKYLSEEL